MGFKIAYPLFDLVFENSINLVLNSKKNKNSFLSSVVFFQSQSFSQLDNEILTMRLVSLFKGFFDLLVIAF